MDPITIEDVTGALPAPIPAPRVSQAEAWCKAISALLTARYRAAPDVDDETKIAQRDYLIVKVADAISRRLEKSPLMVQQNAGPFGGRWHDKAALAAWFLPEELDEMDELMNVAGGSRTYRTPAPREFWASNRIPMWEEEDPDVYPW